MRRVSTSISKHKYLVYLHDDRASSPYYRVAILSVNRSTGQEHFTPLRYDVRLVCQPATGKEREAMYHAMEQLTGCSRPTNSDRWVFTERLRAAEPVFDDDERLTGVKLANISGSADALLEIVRKENSAVGMMKVLNTPPTLDEREKMYELAADMLDMQMQGVLFARRG